MKQFIKRFILLMLCCMLLSCDSGKEPTKPIDGNTATKSDSIAPPPPPKDTVKKAECDTAATIVNSAVKVCKTDTCKSSAPYLQFITGTCTPPCVRITAALLNDLQYLESTTKARLKITSARRTAACNAAIGGAVASSHLNDPIIAIDIQAVTGAGGFDGKAHNALTRDILKQGAAFRLLLAKGYCGFGLYDRHIHLDKDSHKATNRAYRGKRYRMWRAVGNAAAVGC